VVVFRASLPSENKRHKGESHSVARGGIEPPTRGNSISKENEEAQAHGAQELEGALDGRPLYPSLRWLVYRTICSCLRAPSNFLEN